jgi:Smg protein
MFDVLAYLFEQYRDPESFDDRNQLTHQLEAAGFDDEDIQDALDWLESLCHLSDGAFSGADQAQGMRLYTETEQKRLSVEVRGLLQFLEDQGALSGAQREMVIDRLLALPNDEINVPSAKLVALMVLWVQKAELPILLGEELLDAVHGEPTMQ